MRSGWKSKNTASRSKAAWVAGQCERKIMKATYNENLDTLGDLIIGWHTFEWVGELIYLELQIN